MFVSGFLDSVDLTTPKIPCFILYTIFYLHFTLVCIVEVPVVHETRFIDFVCYTICTFKMIFLFLMKVTMFAVHAILQLIPTDNQVGGNNTYSILATGFIANIKQFLLGVAPLNMDCNSVQMSGYH